MNAAAFVHQVQIPAAVANVAIQHRPADLVPFYHQSFIDPALRIAQHERLGSGSRAVVAGREDMDAGHSELRRWLRSAIAPGPALGEVGRTDTNLFQQRRRQTEGPAPVLRA